MGKKSVKGASVSEKRVQDLHLFRVIVMRELLSEPVEQACNYDHNLAERYRYWLKHSEEGLAAYRRMNNPYYEMFPSTRGQLTPRPATKVAEPKQQTRE
jgi:hypothetical protein